MLGARIATLRRAKSWSQEQLAHRLQVSPSAIGMYEQGRREPNAEILVAIAKIFDVSVDYLLTGKPAPEEKSYVEQAAKSVFSQTNQQQDRRQTRPLSRQELAVLFAALLMES